MDIVSLIVNLIRRDDTCRAVMSIIWIDRWHFLV